ncbi:ABC transporter, ATP-binding & transmembrane domain isoform 2 [Galdieria sulphuraria]|uniref:ABC transporter, ATP-binding & transmembrane domain isoform 1 n=1 Tax=Galdieria sulphuraria TaxID=130081 RepID=M2W6N8_GALSU|nr:ABC transporter, ATP-binding & transmembrane domain isoform 1 [Galdieria sulphuraria]XP_005707962.1 ABC transporter, ATP-binding & transmembrane domain isoform 2 [Galdieria sulphuraria]EME31441.1 ABC transporter, ATP-binding & transmembrane domain isoform 1 [Galdieria sulphuraria]EME31442.1 ABC transporter, ATP-binding & transmembrane domain isoform 2 [Galdieria sulphuraria]|eukprot:XP_005707961.1 ABC transporter, ATP-binding & transmembrane domain isoform 1 [Galdieria sulphuraria]
MPCTPNNKRRSVIYKLQRKCLSCPYPKVSKPRWCCFHKKGSQDHAKKDNDTGLFAFWKQAWKSPFYVKAENVTAPQVVRRSKVNRLLTLFWQVAKPYWLEETKARWELGSVVALTLLQSGVSVAFSYIGRDFWNALSEKNLENFQHEIILFFTAMVVGVPIFVLYSYFREILSIHWREWLSDRILNKYFEKRGFYYLESNSQVDNPDQRIADDIRAFTNTSLQFILTFIISAVDLISFSVILFSIYPELFLVLIGYASVGTYLTYYIGNRLILLHFDRLQKEADFRYVLVRIRENAESIAFYGGENREQELAKSRLNKALSRTIDIAKLQRNLEFFTNSYRYLIQVLPAWVVSPLYFQGAIGLGVISQSISAFNHILSDLSIIVNRFEQLSQFSAGIDRLGEFLEVLEANESIGIEKDALIQRRETEDIVLQLCNISIMIPSEEPRYLIRDVNLKVERGQRLLIVGASGKGKSSLLRVIAGLWKCGSGTVRCPSLKDTCFLPQRPYCTLGSLREQLIYPKTRQQVNYTDQELIQVLEKVDLLDLFERYNDLDVVRDWSDTLSLGEQQRLAFGRLLLSRPKFVLMDEASSALDLKSEKKLYSFLQESDTIYVSVGHRPSLLQ